MSLSTAGQRLWRATLLAGCAIGLLSASPAMAASTAVNPLGCAPTQDLSSPLGRFGDFNLYAQAPGGGFESGTTGGWYFQNSSISAGNEPYQVTGDNGSSSLRLGAGGVATSSPMCVDETFPNFRFFARNTGSSKSTLRVSVLFMDSKGKVNSTKSGTLHLSGTGWQLVRPLDIGVTIDKTALNGAAPIAFQFAADKAGDWRIDNLLVDPYRRG